MKKEKNKKYQVKVLQLENLNIILEIRKSNLIILQFLVNLNQKITYNNMLNYNQAKKYNYQKVNV